MFEQIRINFYINSNILGIFVKAIKFNKFSYILNDKSLGNIICENNSYKNYFTPLRILEKVMITI